MTLETNLWRNSAKSLAYRISAYSRNRKWEKFWERIIPTSQTTVLDVGFSDKEYSPTDNYLEKHYLYLNNVTALGVDAPREFLIRYPQVKVLQYDGNEFPFSDRKFDVGWSNAVLEHVGNQEQQIVFLKEIHRVARIGFITTPNKHFPIEVHTRTPLLHYLPKSFFDKYLAFIGKKWATGDYMNLLSIKDLKRLLKLAGISNYQIIKNKLCFFTLDFIIIFGEGSLQEQCVNWS